MIKYSDLTICVPAFNEAQIIVEVLNELKEKFPEAQIILVNDASTDSTGDIVEGISGVSVINHSRNMGYGASLKTATRAARTSVVAWYDGDAQHRPEDLKNVVDPVLEGKKDVVIGVRSKGSHVSLDRVPGKAILNFVAQLIVRARVPDLNSGMRAFKRDIIRKYLHLLPDGFSASSTSTIIMMKRGYRVGYESIRTRKRKGRSSIRIFRDGFGTIKLLIRLLVLFEAFRFFLLLGILQSVPAAIYGFFMAVAFHRGLPVLSSTLMLSGFITFLLGIVCDQITELRKERFED